MKTFGVCGHFGAKQNSTDGQTIKTKIFTKYLTQIVGEDNMYCIDTHEWKKHIPGLLFKTFKMCKNCENVVVMLAYNGLKFLLPLIVFFSKIFGCRVHCIVLGAWLAEFLKEEANLFKNIKKIYGIYAETKVSEKSLKDIGLTNVYHIPNCKDLELKKDSENYTFSEPYPLLTFSRVEKPKGIEEACAAIKYVNEKMGRTVFTLDIYGYVEVAYIETFEKMKKELPEYIKYKGIIHYEGAENVVKDYLAMLFPTRYLTEGQPGSLLDCYAAGVPVIATEWQSSREFINDGVTGIIMDFSLENRVFENTLIKVAENPEILTDMRKNCLKAAEQYQASNVVKRFMDIALRKDA